MSEIGVDYGRRRTGFAACICGTVLPQKPLTDSTWSRIAESVRELQELHGIGPVILGLPLTASGKPTELSVEVAELADFLRGKGFDVVLIRETGTTKEAATQYSGNRKDGRRDSLAAALILKRYLGLL